MSSLNRIIVLHAIVLTILCSMADASYDEREVGVCLRNCAQCRDMYGPYFKVQKCADFCVKYKGKLIPDCEDENSIRLFLQAPENDY